MLLSLRKNGLTSLFKEVRVFKVVSLWGIAAILSQIAVEWVTKQLDQGGT